MKLRVFDPPQCCSTGICGEEVDPVLIQMAANLKWLSEKGIDVQRFNLSQQPEAFIAEPAVREAVVASGTDVLPIMVLDGKIVSHSRYPTKEELSKIFGLTFEPEIEEGDDTSTEDLVFEMNVISKSCCSSDQRAQ